MSALCNLDYVRVINGGSMIQGGAAGCRYGICMERTQLDIYVESGCSGCRRASEVAEWVRAHYPLVDVRLLEVRQESTEQARMVRATPSYFLNGHQFSLGNPSQEQLAEALEAPANDSGER